MAYTAPSTLSSTGTQTVVIQPGQQLILPPGAQIVSLVLSGNISVESSCNDLPEPASYKCWRYLWEDVQGDPAYNDAYFTFIEIGGTKYSFASFPSLSGEPNSYDNGAEYLHLAIPLVVPTGLVTAIDSNAFNNKCLKISIPDNLGQPILYWENPMSGGNQKSALFPSDELCDC